MAGLQGEIINLSELTLDSDSGVLLENVSFSFNSSSRVAIVGSNGTGKSTLLRAIARMVEPAEGSIQISKKAVVEYVPQFLPEELKEVPVEQALFEHIAARRPSVEDWKAYMILSKFGLEGDIVQRKFGQLSGGEVNRALLARAVVVEPDFIMLDEPTNHLDIEAAVRFEKMLRSELDMPFCIVSHDRQLLDNCTGQTLFLRDKRVYFFGMPYSQAVEALEHHDLKQQQRRADQEKEIQRLKAAADKMQNWVKVNSDFAPRYQRLRRRAEEIRENRIELTRGNKGKVSLAEVDINVKALLRIPAYTVYAPSGRKLIEIEEFAVAPGERVAVIGRNGVGKSTFLKALIAGFEKEDQQLRFNPQTKIGYFDQELSLLPMDNTPLDFLASRHNGSAEKMHRNLISAGIPYGRHTDLIKNFSGGERARICFASLRIAEPNLLILDEPTNHLDVKGIEELEDQIMGSGAAVIMVSHDRRFVETVAERFFVIRDERLCEVGDIAEYYAEVLTTGQPDEEKTARASPSGPPERSPRTKSSEDEIVGEIDRLEKILKEKAPTDPERARLESRISQLYEDL